MSIFRKIVYTLSPQKVDVLVFEYDLDIPIQPMQARIPIDIKMREEKTTLGKRYVFFAYNEGNLTNRVDLVMDNMLVRQLGFGNSPVIGNTSTNEPYRGNNIQGHMLCHVLGYSKQLSDTGKVYTFTTPDNHISMKVMLKVGFSLLYRAKLYRLLGLVIYKSIIR